MAFRSRRASRSRSSRQGKRHEGALTNNQWEQTKEALRYLRARFLSHLRHGITSEHLFETFVHAEDKPVLRRVNEICKYTINDQSLVYDTKLHGIKANGIEIDVTCQFNIQISKDAEFQFLMPRYLMDGQVLQCSPEMEAYFRKMVTIYFEWAQLHHVLDALRTRCQSAAVMNTICPTFGIMLADVSGSMVWGEKLKSIKPVRELPGIPLALRELAYDMRGVMAKSQILPIEAGRPEDEVKITLLYAAAETAKPWCEEQWSLLPN